jgi:hypothetical protein
MNRQGKNGIRILVFLLSASTTGSVGCPSDYRMGGATAYCDDSGCYECDGDKKCWPVRNPKCARDTDCEPNSVCTNIGCSKACSSSTDCNESEACVTGYCAPNGFSKVTPFTAPTVCTDDAGCKSDEFCNNGSCALRCKSDDDCGPNSVCTPCGKCQAKDVPATCGAQPIFCSDSIPCGAGKTCLKNRCHVQCKEATICPVGQICSSGLCLDDPSPATPQCFLNLECPDGVCINGYCHSKCTISEECSQYSLCTMGVCQPDYNPVK